MTPKKGFTLIEVVVAMLIFGFMITALASIYGTVNRNMLQNYRQNVIKTNTALAMHAIQKNLLEATRIDSPAFGASNTDLAFAVNIDQLTGCYPINPAAPVSVHHFYLVGSQLFYCLGTPVGGGSGCASFPSSIGGPSYSCATPPVLLLENIPVPLPVPMFSRRSSEGVNERDTVAVNLNIFWNAAAAGLPQRNVAHSLQTMVRINRPVAYNQPSLP